MKKVSAVLLVVALLAPAAARAASAEGATSFLNRITSFLRARGDSPPSTKPAPATPSPRNSLQGPPPGGCTCVKSGNLVIGEWVWDARSEDWVCRSINNRAPDLNP